MIAFNFCQQAQKRELDHIRQNYRKNSLARTSSAAGLKPALKSAFAHTNINEEESVPGQVMAKKSMRFSDLKDREDNEDEEDEETLPDSANSTCIKTEMKVSQLEDVQKPENNENEDKDDEVRHESKDSKDAQEKPEDAVKEDDVNDK